MNEQCEIFVDAYRDSADREGLFSRFEPGTRTLPAGFQVAPHFKPLPIDLVLDKDTAVILRDGVTIYVDVLRPVGNDKVPAIVAWSPYGKSRGNAKQYTELFDLLGMDTKTLSGLHKFEGPDPAFWCAQGYAVCNPDPRGSYHSEGDIRVWSRKEGEDYFDLIEWLAVQPWCNGKVGTSGNSYLCISQWFAAAEQPPHLAAIAPWEGMSDIYRDLVVRGGIPDYSFAQRVSTSFVGSGKREDLVREAEVHPLVDDLWQSKIPEFEKIEVPAYIVASYSNSIHTPGTFRGWRRIGSAQKWLRIHNTMEWPDYYEASAERDLLRFFDHYLKSVDNGWQDTPRVRYALLDLTGGDLINLPATSFPPEAFTTARYYLDAWSGLLSLDSPAPAKAIYDSGSEEDHVSFTIEVGAETDVVGYPMARLWVEVDGSDDMDLFVFLEKLDATGKRLEQINIPNKGPLIDQLTQNGAAILKYKGSNGRLRASMRHLDPDQTTELVPAHSFDRVEKLGPGDIVCLDIDLFPVGLRFRPGEAMRLVVSARNVIGGAMPGTENVCPANSGSHIIHTGGRYASFLQVQTRPAR